MAERREVRPPPGLASAARRQPPRPEGLLARLLGLLVRAGTSQRVSGSRPASARPREELPGSGPQGLENEVHAAGPLHPGGDGDFLDDLRVAGGLSYDDVGARGQQPPVVPVRRCEPQNTSGLRPGLRFGPEASGAGGAGGPRGIGLGGKQSPDPQLPLHWPGASLPSAPTGHFREAAAVAQAPGRCPPVVMSWRMPLTKIRAFLTGLPNLSITTPLMPR